MKNYPVFALALACAGGAGAQSSVTLFGVIDAGVSHYSTRSARFGLPTPVTPPGKPVRQRMRGFFFSSSGMSPGTF